MLTASFPGTQHSGELIVTQLNYFSKFYGTENLIKIFVRQGIHFMSPMNSFSLSNIIISPEYLVLFTYLPL